MVLRDSETAKTTSSLYMEGPFGVYRQLIPPAVPEKGDTTDHFAIEYIHGCEQHKKDKSHRR
jgi:hypothetical protein